MSDLCAMTILTLVFVSIKLKLVYIPIQEIQIIKGYPAVWTEKLLKKYDNNYLGAYGHTQKYTHYAQRHFISLLIL